MHSLGGGTGSGLGSRVLEAVRDEYPKAIIIDAAVAPFSAGDTPLQHYNTVLALAHAQEHADAILFYDNDDILRRARQGKRSNASESTGASASAVADSRARRTIANDRAQVDTRDLNEVIAQSIAGLTMPTRHRKRMHRRRRGSGTGSSPSRDLGPGWYDVRADVEADTAFNGAVDDGKRPSPAKAKPAFTASSSAFTGAANGSSVDEEDDYGERGGWIAASIKQAPAGKESSSSAASAAASTVASILSGKAEISTASSTVARTSSSSVLSSLQPCPFDALAFTQDLIPSSLHKFIDVRSALPCPAPGSTKAVTVDSPAASWVALADGLVDAMPRYDKAGRTVTTLASRLVARGASQTDCDSVDPSIIQASPSSASAVGADGRSKPRGQPSSASSIGGARIGSVRTSPLGMKSIPPHWPGLPSTTEWERVSMMVTRATTWSPSIGSMDGCRSSLLSPGPVYPAYQGAPRAMHQQHHPARSLTSASNNDCFVAPLVRTLTRAEELLSVNAYVHWYTRYGVDGEEITSCMGALLDVVEAYRPGGAAVAERSSVARAASSSSSGGGGGAYGGDDDGAYRPEDDGYRDDVDDGHDHDAYAYDGYGHDRSDHEAKDGGFDVG